MRILIVSQYFWPENFRVNDLVLGLRERGHDVTVLTGMPNYPDGHFFKGYGPFSPTRERFGSSDVRRVPLISRGRGRGLRLTLNYLSFAFAASVLGPLQCRGKFDVILVFGPSPVTVALPAILMRRLKRAPMMFWVQDLWPESLSATGAVRSPRILRWVGTLVKFIYRHCDRILIQSEGFATRISAAGGSLDRIRYFPNWAETFYQPVAIEAGAPELGEMPPGFRVLFAGNIGAAQSFPTILAAAEILRQHKEIRWVIVGDGHMRDWVRQEVTARNLGESVHLLGQRPPERMPRYFAIADVLLVTLRSDPIFALTVPSKLQSYLACGRPIAGALDGEGAELIGKSGAGLACAAEDAVALAQLVLTLYRMPRVEREAMGQGGKTYYDAVFNRKHLLDQLEAWMSELSGAGLCVS